MQQALSNAGKEHLRVPLHHAGGHANSMRSGEGIMRMPDGGTYQGGFAEDKFDGQGQYEYPDGSTYVGQWQAGKKHGQVCTLCSIRQSDLVAVLVVLILHATCGVLPLSASPGLGLRQEAAVLSMGTAGGQVLIGLG